MKKPNSNSRPNSRGSAHDGTVHAPAKHGPRGAWPSRPTAHDGRDPRATADMEKRPRTTRYLLRALRHYSSSLRFYRYALPLLLYRGDVPQHPCTPWRDGTGTGRPRRRHPSLQGLAKWQMITSTTTRSGWKRYGEQGCCPRLPPRRWSLTYDGGCVPVSHSESRANQLASELKALPMETLEVTVWPEKARGELAACAPTMRRRPVMARSRR